MTMTLTTLPVILALGSGGLVGLVLGLVGGGGSILAVPLLVYVVGVSSPHVAIGTSAVGVALNALMGLAAHARTGMIKWRCAAVFSAAGILGSAIGAAAGKAVNGQRLLALFGLIMVAVGLSMFRRKSIGGNAAVELTSATARVLVPPLLAVGFGVGLLSGFFGIGGGFLIVPGLMLATGMPIGHAIGTSLIGIAAFGLTTAGSYAASGLVDWRLAALLVCGGAVGSFAGTRLNRLLAAERHKLTIIFATFVITVGALIVTQGLLRMTGS